MIKVRYRPNVVTTDFTEGNYLMLTTPATTTVTSNVAAGAQVMGIDANGMGTVLSILSNMYSDGNLAIVREYSCNARDSHVEAGNSDPILVTTPTAFNPTFVVEDFGVGLSHDEVLNVYAKYGASTKRGCRSKVIRCTDGSCDECQRANTQIGAFGIGAKSAFTVGTQFVVTAVKDGEKTIALFALNEGGAPTVNILSRESTDEPNGVKVEIGVRDVKAVQAAIDRLFATWERGTVLVDGVEPTPLFEGTTKLAENIYLRKRDDRYNTPAFMVIMGGVSYALPTSVINALPPRVHRIVQNVTSSDTQIIFVVEIGLVDITPSREDLANTPKTVQTIGHEVERFYHSLPGYVNDLLTNAKTRVAAVVAYRKVVREIGNFAREALDGFTWQGQKVAAFTPIKTKLFFFELRRKARSSSYHNEMVARRYEDFSVVVNSPIEQILFVVNTPDRRVRSVQLAAKPYLESQKKIQNGNVVLGNTMVVAVHDPYLAQDWFDTRDSTVQTVEYEDFIKQWKPASGTPGSGNRAPAYDVQSVGTLSVADLLELDAVVYFEDSEHSSLVRNYHSIYDQLQQKFDIIVLRPQQTVAALLKRVPEARDGKEEMRKIAEKTLKTIKHADREEIARYLFNVEVSHYSTQIEFLKLHRNKVTNPVVLRLLDLHQHQSRGLTPRLRELTRAAELLGLSTKSFMNEYKSGKLDLPSAEKVFNSLPLIVMTVNWGYQRLNALAVEHLINYVNSITL